jgi:hypothetical protein
MPEFRAPRRPELFLLEARRPLEMELKEGTFIKNDFHFSKNEVLKHNNK